MPKKIVKCFMIRECHKLSQWVFSSPAFLLGRWKTPIFLQSGKKSNSTWRLWSAWPKQEKKTPRINCMEINVIGSARSMRHNLNKNFEFTFHSYCFMCSMCNTSNCSKYADYSYLLLTFYTRIKSDFFLSIIWYCQHCGISINVFLHN